MPIIDFTNVEKVYRGSVEMKKVYEGTTVVWEKSADNKSIPLYIELVNPTDSTSIKIKNSGTATKALSYSYDNQTWNSYTAGGSSPSSLSLNSSHPRIYFKATSSAGWSTNSSYWYFQQTASPQKQLKVGGNIYSLENTDASFDAIPNSFRPLVNYSFYKLFQNLSGLVDASNLFLGDESTKLTIGCFSHTFENCTSLVNPPELSVELLETYCYEYMFSGCTSLTSAPQLLASHAFDYCYSYMFNGCTSLTSAEVSPVIADAYSLSYMFYGCSSLNHIKCMCNNFDSTALGSWVSGVAATGTFECYDKVSGLDSNDVWVTGINGIPSGWTTVQESYYFYIKNENSGSISVSFTKNGSPTGTLQRSTDLTTWTTISVSSSVTLSSGGKVYLRMDGTTNSSANYWSISSVSHYSVGGDIRTIKKYSNLKYAPIAYGFYRLFNNCTGIVSAKNLRIPYKDFTITQTSSSQTYATDICSNMFFGCTSLREAPQLPANKVSVRCYSYMFAGCTSLEKMPALPITTMNNYTSGSTYRYADRCCQYMFSGCTSLKKVFILPATTIAAYCYSHMFENCTSLTNIPMYMLPAITLYASGSSGTATYHYSADNCYEYMFYGCTSLKNSASVQATTFAFTIAATGTSSYATVNYVCYHMYDGCTSLTKVQPYQSGMFYATYRNTDYYATQSYAYMYANCTSLTQSPDFSTKKLGGQCYLHMFDGCTSLNYIRCTATSISGNAAEGWTNGVAATGTFTKKSSMTGWPTGVDGIPSGWTVVNV